MRQTISRPELFAALDAQSAVLRRELNDRFDQQQKMFVSLVKSTFAVHEEKEELRHRELIEGVGESFERLSDHMDTELQRLRDDIDIRQEFRYLISFLATKFQTTVSELTGKKL